MGNHERKHVHSYRGETQPALSQLITRREFGEDYYAYAIEFMDRLPRYLELPECVLVHGFFEPNVPLASLQEVVIVGTMAGEEYLTRRYSRPWYELYDGAKPNIVGHHDYLRNGNPFVYRERVFCLDTGCYRGGALRGLILPDFRIISVPSRKDYWMEIKDQNADIRFGQTPDESLTWNEVEALGSLFRPIFFLISA
jgi:serine/threonine protein phosphatase 1